MEGVIFLLKAETLFWDFFPFFWKINFLFWKVIFLKEFKKNTNQVSSNTIFSVLGFLRGNRGDWKILLVLVECFLDLTLVKWIYLVQKGWGIQMKFRPSWKHWRFRHSCSILAAWTWKLILIMLHLKCTIFLQNGVGRELPIVLRTRSIIELVKAKVLVEPGSFWSNHDIIIFIISRLKIKILKM